MSRCRFAIVIAIAMHAIDLDEIATPNLGSPIIITTTTKSECDDVVVAMQWYIILAIVIGSLLAPWIIFLLLMPFEGPQRQYYPLIYGRLIVV